MRTSRTGRTHLARIVTTSASLLVIFCSSLAFADAASAANASPTGVESNHASEIGDFHGSVTAAGMLRLDACGVIPEEGSPLDSPMNYQYSKHSTGPWHLLGNGAQRSAADCNGSGGSYYPATFRVPLAHGYYRAMVPEIAGEQASAVSKVIHLGRDTTKITSFAVRRVAGRPATVTVTGRLWWRTGRFRPDSGRTITIGIVSAGRVRVVGHLTTSKFGHFSGSFRHPQHDIWIAIFAGVKNQFAAEMTTHGTR